MNTKNKILLSLFAAIYLLTLYLLFLPAIEGLHSSRTLQSELDRMQVHFHALEAAGQSFEMMNREWGDQLVFTEATLLVFILDLMDDYPVRLVDFSGVQVSSEDSDIAASDRYHFEIRGEIFATLSFLNAIEQRFPFATLEEISMEKKRLKRVQFIETHFYLQQ